MFFIFIYRSVFDILLQLQLHRAIKKNSITYVYNNQKRCVLETVFWEPRKIVYALLAVYGVVYNNIMFQRRTYTRGAGRRQARN